LTGTDLVASTLSFAPEYTVAENEPLNVIILYPDDWRHDDIGGLAPVVGLLFSIALPKKALDLPTTL
jgi:hypothetical protein